MSNQQPNDTLDKYITIKQFADLQGVSRQAICYLIKRYNINVQRMGTMKLVLKSDAVKFEPRLVNTQVRLKLKEYAKHGYAKKPA